jgi:hypothetical protein
MSMDMPSQGMVWGRGFAFLYIIMVAPDKSDGKFSDDKKRQGQINDPALMN